MEALLALFIPIALLWFGMALLLGRPVTPGAVIPLVFRQLSRGIRWLWQEKPQRGGAGRAGRPPRRYRR